MVRCGGVLSACFGPQVLAMYSCSFRISEKIGSGGTMAMSLRFGFITEAMAKIRDFSVIVSCELSIVNCEWIRELCDG